MDGDSGDVNYLGDPLLCVMMSNLCTLPREAACGHTFVSSVGCHMVAKGTYVYTSSCCFDAGLIVL